MDHINRNRLGRVLLEKVAAVTHLTREGKKDAIQEYRKLDRISRVVPITKGRREFKKNTGIRVGLVQRINSAANKLEALSVNHKMSRGIRKEHLEKKLVMNNKFTRAMDGLDNRTRRRYIDSTADSLRRKVKRAAKGGGIQMRGSENLTLDSVWGSGNKHGIRTMYKMDDRKAKQLDLVMSHRFGRDGSKTTHKDPRSHKDFTKQLEILKSKDGKRSKGHAVETGGKSYLGKKLKNKPGLRTAASYTGRMIETAYRAGAGAVRAATRQ